MSIKVISFDFWDTIFKMENEFDPQMFRLQKMNSFMSKYKKDLDISQIKPLYKEVWAKFEKEWIENYRTLSTEEILDFIFERVGISLPDDEKQELVKYFQEAILQSPPALMDGVKESIIELSKNYKLGIISDTGFTPGTVLRKILEINGLDKYFSVLIFSDEFGRSKPHPDTFNTLASKCGVATAEMVHIGDNERTDVAGANSVNAKSIIFTKGSKEFTAETKASGILYHWNSIEEILSGLEKN